MSCSLGGDYSNRCDSKIDRVKALLHNFAKSKFSEGQGKAPHFSAILRVCIIPLSAKSLYTFSILYPMPICVWIYCGESGSDSSFLRSVAIKTRSEATSLSQELPQTSWVI